MAILNIKENKNILIGRIVHLPFLGFNKEIWTNVILKSHQFKILLHCRPGSSELIGRQLFNINFEHYLKLSESLAGYVSEILLEILLKQ